MSRELDDLLLTKADLEDTIAELEHEESNGENVADEIDYYYCQLADVNYELEHWDNE